MKDLKLSIITINLNNKIGLTKTINSVINQSTNQFDFIIIDGGSNDGSKEVILAYEDKINYWCSEPDSGIYNAMNKGIRKAMGQYCLFLNSGDLLTHENVIKQVFEGDIKEDIIICGCRFSQNNNVIHEYYPEKNITMRFFFDNMIPHQSTFIKREFFEKYGYYSEAYKLLGDFELWIRSIIIQNCTIKAIPILVSDYNLEGRSSQLKYKEIYLSERNYILENFLPERVIEDYKYWENQRRLLEDLYWARSKKSLYFVIKNIYNLAKWFNKVKKHNV